MPRIRSIKYEFFVNEELASVSPMARLLFIGLWTIADKAGRLEDRPLRIKAQLFPYEPADIDSLLNELQTCGVLSRYVVENKGYIYIINFEKHQKPHPKEAESVYPSMKSPEKKRQRREKVSPSPEKDSTSSVVLGEGVGACTSVNGSGEDGAVAPALSDEEWLAELQAQPEYAKLNVKLLFGKMSTWCSVNNKQPTRRRFVNWLNREDQPMEGNNGSGRQGQTNAVSNSGTPKRRIEYQSKIKV